MATNSQFHNPYVGPRPFEREEKNLFFGREREISELQSLLTAQRTLLLYAASGAGKTSLLNAGLLPLMEKEGFEVLLPARVRGLSPEGIRPGDVSNIYVFNTLMGWAGDEPSYEALSRTSLAEFLRRREHILDTEGFSAPRLIIFDQFEELFTLYQEHWKQREGFFHQVTEALREDPVLRVLFVMREDYLARLDPYVSLLPERLRVRYRLVRLRFEDACQAVEGPLEGSGRSFAHGVSARLVGELLKTKVQSVTGKTVEAVGEYAEPVQLQIVCRNLWDSLPADAAVVTSEHLRSFGDVDEALKAFYENAVQKTVSETNATEEALRKWFARELITPAGTRGTAYRGKADTAGIPNAAVDILENEHILRGEQRSGAHWYELTHDRLIEPIRNSNATWFPDYEVEQARLRGRKNLFRSLFVIVAVVMVILTALTIFSFIKANQAERALNTAEIERVKAEMERVKAEMEHEKALEAFKQEQLANIQAKEAAIRSALAIKAIKNNGKLTEKEKKEIKQLTESLSGSTPTQAIEDVAFDPQRNRISIPGKGAPNPAEKITLEAWFNTGTLGTRQAIITKLHPGYKRGEPYYQYNLELRQGGTLYFALAINGVRRYIDGAFLVDPQKWYHVAATYDGELMQLYLGGRKWETTDPNNYRGTLGDYGMPLEVGGNTSDRPFNGRLAEVRIWNVARSADQIRADMQKKLPLETNGLVWSSSGLEFNKDNLE